jgi:hypothetical protein
VARKLYLRWNSGFLCLYQKGTRHHLEHCPSSLFEREDMRGWVARMDERYSAGGTLLERFDRVRPEMPARKISKDEWYRQLKGGQ